MLTWLTGIITSAVNIDLQYVAIGNIGIDELKCYTRERAAPARRRSRR